jgi:hypothetical protein
VDHKTPCHKGIGEKQLQILGLELLLTPYAIWFTLEVDKDPTGPTGVDDDDDEVPDCIHVNVTHID